jgi:two-component system chemotaxis response regulator CheB
MRAESRARDVVVIGGSHGGLDALEKILSPLPSDCPLRISVALHQYRHGTGRLDRVLRLHTGLPVTLINDKDSFEPGRVYVSPANYHVLFEDDGSFSLNTDAPVQFARPSLDVFFESAARVFKHRLMGILLSGASKDGADGLKIIKQLGGWTACQAPSDAVNPIMPEAGMEIAQPDCVEPAATLGARLAERCT